MEILKDVWVYFVKFDPVIQLAVLMLIGWFIWNNKKQAPAKEPVKDKKCPDLTPYIRREECHNSIDGMKELFRVQLQNMQNRLTEVRDDVRCLMKKYGRLMEDKNEPD